jgi:hypothetical protein
MTIALYGLATFLLTLTIAQVPAIDFYFIVRLRAIYLRST